MSQLSPLLSHAQGATFPGEDGRKEIRKMWQKESQLDP